MRYSLSYRDIEELMEERGVNLDHATVQRWVIKYTPLLEAEFRKKKKAVGSSWRMDETYIKVKGIWHYLYRAVDKGGNTIDFLLTKKRDTKAAIEEYNSKNNTSIEIRRIKYLNNIVEQDHRGIKRIMDSILGFKSFDSAAVTLNGIEIVHMIRKRQLRSQEEDSVKNLADIFYSLAA